jgi:hypothetical protein
MNRFDVEIMAPNEWGARRALLRIDGRPLLELIKEIETPIAAAAEEPSLAGTYSYLNSHSVVLPSRQLLGSIEIAERKGDKVPVLMCDCGEIGCWPLLARITTSQHEVVWSEFEQPHRSHWTYPADLRFVFDRTQYEEALRIEACPQGCPPGAE